MPSSSVNDYSFHDGASEVPSLIKGAIDIRSGNVGDNSTVILETLIAGKGHNLDSVSLSYKYVCGYNSLKKKDGPALDIAVLDASDQVVKVIYSSPVLNKYSFDHFKGYSPAIDITASNLALPNTYGLKLAILFHNNAGNLQLSLDQSAGLNVKVLWSAAKSPPPPGPAPSPAGAATNAAAVLRGPLLYSILLEQEESIVRVWPTFNNTDINLVTKSSWNYLIDTASPLEYERLLPGAADVPFGISEFPGVIHATGRQLSSWVASKNAADEPPPSPIKCSTLPGGCGPPVKIKLVPYGATNLRMSGLPWTAK